MHKQDRHVQELLYRFWLQITYIKHFYVTLFNICNVFFPITQLSQIIIRNIRIIIRNIQFVNMYFLPA